MTRYSVNTKQDKGKTPTASLWQLQAIQGPQRPSRRQSRCSLPTPSRMKPSAAFTTRSRDDFRGRSANRAERCNAQRPW